jgi:hypothetical protein
MPIYQFDRMSDNDDVRYIDSLVKSVEAASQGDPALYAQVKRFFKTKQPGEAISGMGKFELNMAYARIADLQAVAKNPKVPRLQVEDVLYVTMVDNGITLPNHFRPTTFNFRPQEPLGESLTLADAQKALTRTQAWVARRVEPNSPVLSPSLSSSDKETAFWAAIVALLVLSTTKTGNTSNNAPVTSGPYDSNWPPTRYPDPTMGVGFMGQPCRRGTSGCYF